MNDNLTSIFEILLNAPQGFQNWVNEKQIGPRELSPLRAVIKDRSQIHQNLHFLNELYSRLTKFQPSRSIGVQALEWAIEIYMMQEDPFQDLSFDQSFDQWHSWLKEKRFSRRYQTKEYLEKQLKTVSWPRGSKVSIFEAGDKMGLEVRLQAADASELTQKAQTLTQTAAQLAQKTIEELQ